MRAARTEGRIRLLPLRALALALALVAAACGGAGEGVDEGDAVDPATASAEEETGGESTASAAGCGDELKIGILVALTGELGDFGKSWQQAMELAVANVNESGGLPDGWEMTSVVGDEKTDAEEGLRAAQQMINNENVSAIIGPSSGPIVAMVDLAADTETPIISEAAGTPRLNELGGEWVYRTVPSDLSGGVAASTWFNDQGLDSIAMMILNEESTITEAIAVKDAWLAEGGEISAEVNFAPGQASYQAELQQVLNVDPEMIFLAAGQESGVTIVREARQLGYDGGIFVSGDMVVPEVLEAIGPEGGELYGQAAEADTTLEGYTRFAEQFEEEYGTEPGLYTPNAYDAVELVALAATAANSTCGADINAQLREVADPPGTAVGSFAEGAEALAAGEDIAYEGTSGPVDFDESGTVAGAYGIFQAQDGAWEQIEFYPADVFNE